MKKLLLSIGTAATVITADAQNLVPNHSFDSYVTCPVTTNAPVSPLSVSNWFQPTKGTPDFFHICNNSMGAQVGVPDNIFGHQAVSSGEGYMGIIAYNGMVSVDYKEYISSALIAPMVPGENYTVSVDISLADLYGDVACAGFGIYLFTDTLPAVYKTMVSTLPFTPQVDYGSYGIITDTQNWVTLIDTFQADSAYKYMIFGATTPKSSMIKSGNGNSTAYYYVDNVRIALLSGTTQIENLILPSLAISPNPVQDKAVLRLLGNSKQPYSISLVNMLGQTVWERKDITEKEIMFERGTLPFGVYGYRWNVKGQPTQKGKLIIQ